MVRDTVSVKEALEVLNRAAQADREAIEKLLELRVECNNELSADPEIQIGIHMNGKSTISFLGLLNGLFGEEEGFGAILAFYKLKCSENKEHRVGEDQLIMDACEECGAELVLGDFVEFGTARDLS